MQPAPPARDPSTVGRGCSLRGTEAREVCTERLDARLPGLARHGPAPAPARLRAALLERGFHGADQLVHAADDPAGGVDRGNLGRCGCHHREPRAQVLAELHRVDVTRVLVDDERHQADVAPLQHGRETRVRQAAEEVNVGPRGERAQVGVRGAHQRETPVGPAIRERGEQRRVDPPVEQADDREHRSTQARHLDCDRERRIERAREVRVVDPVRRMVGRAFHRRFSTTSAREVANTTSAI